MEEISKVEFSIVIPVYNSEGTLADLTDRVLATIKKEKWSCEIILVDDSSSDKSWNKIMELSSKHPQIKGIRLKHNHGQLWATHCGISHSIGKTILTMDDDLQFIPEDLPLLVNEIRNGRKNIVWGDPGSGNHGRLRKWISLAGKFFFHKIVLIPYSEINFFSTFRAMNADWVKKNGSLRNLFFIWEFEPSEMTHVPVFHFDRKSGKSNYSPGKWLRYFSPFIFYSVKKISTQCFFIILLVLLIFLLTSIEITGKYLLIFLSLLTIDIGILSLSTYYLKVQRDFKYEISEITL